MRDAQSQAERIADGQRWESTEQRLAYIKAWAAGCEYGRWEDGTALRDNESAHHALDMMGVKRETPGGETLTVRGRIDVLRGIV